MSQETRQFKPQTVPTILMVLLVPLFVGLGIWQLDRAEQKRQMAAAQESRRKLPAYPLNQGVPEASQRAFRSAVAEGRFLPDKSVLIENRKYLGKNGYHLIAPFQLADSGQVVLINRGWIPRERVADDRVLNVPVGHLRVAGLITQPEAPALKLALPPDTSEATPRWPFLTLEHYAAWSGLEILPFALLESPQDEGDFVRDWPEPVFSDAMHIGYAIQWFAFAAMTLLIWLRLSLRKTSAPLEASV